MRARDRARSRASERRDRARSRDTMNRATSTPLPPRTCSSRTTKQQQQLQQQPQPAPNKDMLSSSLVNARRQGGANRRNSPLFCILIGFALAHFDIVFHWLRQHHQSSADNTAIVVESMWLSSSSSSSLSPNDNDNNNNGIKQPQRQQPWASLSSPFPPPRAPPAHRTLWKRKWRP